MKIFSKVCEFFVLLAINLKVTFKSFLEWMKVIGRFYKNQQFRRLDLHLLALYLFNNPYKMSKRFLQRRGEEEIDVYGETPLTTMELIAERLEFKAGECVFELGCGRGRTCFWLNVVRGCRVVGIEWLPEFIERAEKVKKRAGLQDVEFRCEDLSESDFSGADVVYIYGTTWSDALIEKIAEKCSVLKPGAKVVTVSYLLLPYSPVGIFEVVDQFTAPFLWGEAEVFVQRIK